MSPCAWILQTPIKGTDRDRGGVLAAGVRGPRPPFRRKALERFPADEKLPEAATAYEQAPQAFRLRGLAFPGLALSSAFC